jgi:hypothetical protein
LKKDRKKEGDGKKRGNAEEGEKNSKKQRCK